MAVTLDEEVAWRLVLAVSRRTRAESPPGEVHAESGAGEWLKVQPAGEWTTSGEATAAARDLLDLYLPLALGPDLVIGQLGQSIDGRIATASGDSYYVTGPADIVRLHRLRALVDAVIVGAGTVEQDDPRLTVRRVSGDHPVRVVLDPQGRMRPALNLFQDGAATTIVVRRREGVEGFGELGSPPVSAPAGVETLWVETSDAGGFEPSTILAELRARGLRRVLVEGGGITVSRFLEAGVLDRLHVAVAPLLIGSGRPALTLVPISSLSEALRPACRHFKLGDDLLFDLQLR
jgi:diaminohydroxyphosphoribosylaminopyrimidine deaminase / 5-amino-6-(5-phosphoribosylamino)uracil reductase